MDKLRKSRVEGRLEILGCSSVALRSVQIDSVLSMQKMYIHLRRSLAPAEAHASKRLLRWLRRWRCGAGPGRAVARAAGAGLHGSARHSAADVAGPSPGAWRRGAQPSQPTPLEIVDVASHRIAAPSVRCQ